MEWFNNPLILWAIILGAITLLFKVLAEMEKLKSKIRSVSVVHGQSWEKFVPFMKDFKYDVRDCVAVYKPIDLIVFDLEHDRIVFVEVKTGKSKLTEKEERIKRIVDDKRVSYEVIG